MAGVFKSLDKSDVWVTPFRAYKLWNEGLSYCDKFSNLTGSLVGDITTMASSASFVYVTDASTVARVDTNSDYADLASVAPSQGVVQMTNSRNGYLYVAGLNTEVYRYSSSLSGTVSTWVDPNANTQNCIAYDPINDIVLVGSNGTLTPTINSITSNLSATLNSESAYGFGGGTLDIEAESAGIVGSYFTLDHSAASYWLSVRDSSLAITDAFVIGTYDATQARVLFCRTTECVYALGGTNLLIYNSATTATSSISNVGAIVRSRSNYTDTFADQSTKIHVITRDGLIYLNHPGTTGITLSSTSSPTIDTRQLVGPNRYVISAAMGPDNYLGILAISDSSDDVVFYAVDTVSGAVTNPIHLGAVRHITKVYGGGGDSTELPHFMLFNNGSVHNDPYFAVVCNLTPSHYTVYRADYNPASSITTGNPLQVTFDQGNPAFDAHELTTANGKFQRIMHRSLDHLFYRDWYTNNKATFGSGNINKQFRLLEDKALVISLPQQKFGESIKPTSVLINARYGFGVDDQTTYQDITIVDDEYGNLYVSGAFEFRKWSGDGTYEPVTASMVGEFPIDEGYKYSTYGAATFTASFCRGLWPMSSIYNHVAFEEPSWHKTGFLPLDGAQLGFMPKFTRATTSTVTSLVRGSTTVAVNPSYIKVIPKDVSDYRKHYNFQNGNFSISAVIGLTAYPPTPTGRAVDSGKGIVITKQGPEDDIRVDSEGRVHFHTLTTRSPYRVYVDHNGFVNFERDSGLHISSVRYTSSLALNTTYHIAAIVSESVMQLYVDGVLVDSAVDAVDPHGCNDGSEVYSNLSDIYIGNTYDGLNGFDGYIDQVRLYKTALTETQVGYLTRAWGYNSKIVGNAFYKQGLLVLGHPIAQFMEITNVSCKGTQTIYETEVACTVGPGEFNMTTNPTTMGYDPTYNQFVYCSFVTGSEFKPYVTTIGLYDDEGHLLVIGKLAQAVKLPNNCDTTFIVRFDR